MGWEIICIPCLDEHCYFYVVPSCCCDWTQNFLRETVGQFLLQIFVVYLTSFKTHTHLALDMRQVIR